MMQKCGVQTKAGAPCRFPALEGVGACGVHHPDPEERRRIQAERGYSGGKTNKRPRRTSCPLSTTAEILTALERMALRIENAKGDVAPRANALAKMASTAWDIVKCELERENADMRTFIEKHHPDAKPLLRAVK